MFGEDEDFKKLVPIAPAIIYEMREEFRAKFEVVIKEMKHFVLKKSHEKAEEIAMIRKCIQDVKSESDRDCMVKLEAYQHDRKLVKCNPMTFGSSQKFTKIFSLIC